MLKLAYQTRFCHKPDNQRLLDAIFDFLGSLLQLQRFQFGNHGFRLLTGGFLALLRVDRLEHLRHDLDL